MHYPPSHHACSLLRRASWTLGLLAATAAQAAPTVTRLSPPSELFATGQAAPVIARFLPGQRFDLQATLRPDAPEQHITQVRFSVDGTPVDAPLSLRSCASGCTPGLPANVSIASARAVSFKQPGVHELRVWARQSDGQIVQASGNFEVVALTAGGRKIKNLIFMLGDGMGAAQRTAARIVHAGYAQGKSLQPLAMDSFPVTGLVKTSSLNAIVTDSSPGMASYVSGNKHNNNQEGVFPDDTLDPFDNPRVEYLSEYLHRTQGKALGLVTTADVFDATPAANAVHTSNRGAGTGIVDQYLDDRGLHGLQVLLGGGRKWFLPAGTPGSARAAKTDYAFQAEEAHSGDIARRWGAAAGALDPQRNLIADFEAAGFHYVANKTEMDAAPARAQRLLGLFALSNMNVALDKIQGRRSPAGTRTVVQDFGFPDQPMLDEMADKALQVLKRSPKGFVLMIEGASIDKQAHNMDTERWILETIEFDRAVRVAQQFAEADGETLVIVTADHECSGVALIGSSRLSEQALQTALREAQAQGGANAATLRDKLVGVYEQSGFPRYRRAEDGYPVSTDIDFRLLVGYGANADRHENWHGHALPLQDSQQPWGQQAPLSGYPANPVERARGTGYWVTGQVPGDSAVHTATDVPLSATGPGAYAFTGVMDNTDVFFKIAQGMLAGVPTVGELARRKP